MIEVKRLQDGNTKHTEWDKQIITDLSYIKRHLRYPMHRKVITPIIFWIVLFLLISGLVLSAVLEKDTSSKSVIAFAPLILPWVIILYYVHSLRFTKVQTPYTLAQNIGIIEQFLKTNHLLIFRHPEAPEVFQIVSKDISAGKEEREMMFFIADDYRILVNSQFTQSGWSLPQGKNHVNQMCENLMRFIKRMHVSLSTDIQPNF